MRSRVGFPSVAVVVEPAAGAAVVLVVAAVVVEVVAIVVCDGSAIGVCSLRISLSTGAFLISSASESSSSDVGGV